MGVRQPSRRRAPPLPASLYDSTAGGATWKLPTAGLCPGWIYFVLHSLSTTIPYDPESGYAWLGWSVPRSFDDPADPAALSLSLQADGDGHGHGLIDMNSQGRASTAEVWPAPGSDTFFGWSWDTNTFEVNRNGVTYTPAFPPGYGPGANTIKLQLLLDQISGNVLNQTRGTILRVAAGRGRLTPAQWRVLASANGFYPSLVAVLLGDSLTGLFNDYPLTLATLLGGQSRRAAVAANWGVSGDTLAQISARVAASLKNKPRVAFVLGGTNDLWRDGASFSSRQATWQGIFDALRAGGVETIAVGTVPPLNQALADVHWPGWFTAPHIAEVAAANAWLRSKPANVDVVVDCDLVVGDGNGQQRSDTTDDGVHLNPTVGSPLLAAAVHAQVFDSRSYP